VGASCDELGVMHILEEQLLDVPETSLIDGLSQELARRLREVGLQLRHVHVINKEDLAATKDLWCKLVLTLLIKVTLEGVLQILAAGLTGEVNESWVNVLISIHEVVLGNDRLTNTSLTGEQHVVIILDECTKQVLVLGGVVGWHQNIEEADRWVVLESGQLLDEWLQTVLLSMDTIFIDITLRELWEVLSHLSSDDVTKDWTGGVVKVSTNGPNKAEGQVHKDSLVWVWNLILVVKRNLLPMQVDSDHVQAGGDQVANWTIDNLLALSLKSV
jgi:hypothetical protein